MLKVPSNLADKKISCPACQKAFRIPRAKFEAAERVTQQTTVPAPRSVTATAAAPAAVPVEANMMPANLDDELGLSDLPGPFDHSTSDILGDLAELQGGFRPPHAPVGAADSAVELQYVRGVPAVSSARSRLDKGVVQGPRRGFWADAFRSFIYPFLTGSNVATFGIIAFACLVRIFLSMVGIFGLVGSLIIFGWLASLYMSVVQETATGSEDLPGIKMEDGFLEDIVKPAFKYIGAFAVALAPTAFYTIAVAFGWLPPWMDSAPAKLMWLALGVFIWPVILMLFAFGAFDMVYRVDLIFTTIFRTLGAYLAMWLMLLLVGFVFLSSIAAPFLAHAGIPSNGLGLHVSGLGWVIVLEILEVYLTIVSMRLIGLYYLHYKRRFAIILE